MEEETKSVTSELKNLSITTTLPMSDYKKLCLQVNARKGIKQIRAGGIAEYQILTRDDNNGNAVYDFNDQEQIYLHALLVLPKKHLFSVEWIYSLFFHFDNVYCAFNEQKVNVPQWFATKYPPQKHRVYPLEIHENEWEPCCL